VRAVLRLLGTLLILGGLAGLALLAAGPPSSHLDDVEQAVVGSPAG
jgi:hypothetical protein